MSKIVLEHIDKFYGDNHVLRDISLTIDDGDFMTLLGPSGCGKTTTLRVISGLEKPQNGRMFMDGKTMIDADAAFFEMPSKRGLNLVFQSYALWPHMTAFENVAFGLKIKKLPRHEVEEKVLGALRVMRIEEYRDRYPNELSGGQQQRVAIARAIATSPKLLLLDEPLSNLDARLRIDMRAELKRLHRETGTTIIYVTHDQVEALTMSTKIALFKEGVISQVDTPLGIYTNPVDLDAADFIGNPRINFIQGRAVFDGETLRVTSELGEYGFPRADMKQGEECPVNEAFDCVLGVRPEMIELSKQYSPHPCAVEASVYASQPAGSETLITLTVGKSEFLAIQLGLAEYEMNQKVYAVLHPERMNVYNKATGRLIKYAAASHQA
ncbi:MAG: Trehalose import ATP-binding protein SugC [Firmicutes bacterium ADurb.Bin248]|mgnify:CR=1 FL=1|nr:MAG: Trehalose import ATP-binding protein SugC [Firmicutes bacterium ADurb.Bin248]HOG01177.1 ABC transporter ATP-binding protein [Clostridia bacterium]HPK15144.1 ABC transporter ATP-binding protein [Clostridia bacterium]